MFKKSFLISSVLFGLLFFVMAGECLADATAKYDQAERYMKSEYYEEARQLYQYVLDTWPEDSYYAICAQAGVAKSNIALGNTEIAEAAIDKLLANYSGNEHMATCLCNIAQHCDRFGKYEKAKQLFQHILDNWPQDYYAMWSQVGLAESDLSLGNTKAAEAAIEKLLADYSGNMDIAAAVCNIAQYYYNRLGNYEKAEQFYQYIIDNWPEDTYAMWARMGLGQVSAALDSNNVAGEVAMESIIADLNDHPDLPTALFVAGNEDYKKALRMQNEGLDAEAKEYFTKAIAVWEKIMQEFPKSNATPRACYFSAQCYRRLAEYEKAIERCKKMVDNWPDDEYAGSAQFLIGVCFEGLRDSGTLPQSEANAKIEQAYKLVVEKYPHSSSVEDACRELGWLNFKRGQWAEAASYFELCRGKSPKDYLILYPLGRAYEEIGRLDKAKQVYNEFINTVPPTDPRVEKVKARLEKLALSR